MAYRLPKRGEDLSRETSGGDVPLRPKGVQVAEISPQQRTDLDRHLDTKIGDLAKKAGKFAPWPVSGWTLREGLQSSLTRNDILKELEPALKAQGVTVKELDDAVAGKPLPAPKAPEKPAETPKAPGVPLPPSTPKPAPAATAAPPAAPLPPKDESRPMAAPLTAKPVQTEKITLPDPAETPKAPEPAPAAQMSPVQPWNPQAPLPPRGGAVPRMEAYKQGIAGIESGGRYGALGKVLANGDQALGKYQIMASNVPQWSKDALGQSISREQFLKSPELQDKIFEHRFGQYVQKYGEEGAARAWYAGEKGMKNLGATDVHGRVSVAGYGKDFTNRIGKDIWGPGNQAKSLDGTKLADAAEPPNKAATQYALGDTPKLEGSTLGGGTGTQTAAIDAGMIETPAEGPTAVADAGGGGGALGAGKDAVEAAAAPEKGFDWGKGLGGFGDELGKLGEGMARSAGGGTASRGQNPYVVGAGQMSQPGAPVPIIDPRMVEAQKQQLAMAMQRLNAGKLF